MTGTAIATVLAAGIGLGLYLFLRGFRRRPQDLSTTVQSLQRPGRASATSLVRQPDQNLSSFQRYLARPGLRLLESFGVADAGLLEERLRILDKSLERHAYEKMLGGLAGLLLPIFVAMAFAANGLNVPPVLLVVVMLLLGAGGFLYPDLPLGEKVADRQQAFRHSLSSYLDLVSIILAGGGGTESALVGAAEAGDGWVFVELRSALRRGELTGRSPWEMFEELGEYYGIDELRELASSVALAGGHGARVRQSLVAKSEALRVQQTAEIESQAESNTEKMIIPVSIMVLGLMVFIGRGAVHAIGGQSPTAPQEQTVDEGR
ncbi:MAG: type II secretion system F family protein [Actinomycetota bacterium]